MTRLTGTSTFILGRSPFKYSGKREQIKHQRVRFNYMRGFKKSLRLSQVVQGNTNYDY